MSVLMKTMADFYEMYAQDRIVSMWGTATIAYAIIHISDGSFEMWKVTP